MVTAIPGILARIVDHKRAALAESSRNRARLERRAAERTPARDFKRALTARRRAIIAEIKKASPSKGRSRNRSIRLPSRELCERRRGGAERPDRSRIFSRQAGRSGGRAGGGRASGSAQGFHHRRIPCHRSRRARRRRDSADRGDSRRARNAPLSRTRGAVSEWRRWWKFTTKRSWTRRSIRARTSSA